jgi:hypothetical protein
VSSGRSNAAIRQVDGRGFSGSKLEVIGPFPASCSLPEAVGDLALKRSLNFGTNGGAGESAYLAFRDSLQGTIEFLVVGKETESVG